jgi:hypothetical protein
MKRTLVRFRRSKFRMFLRRHEKYGPVAFFIGGFIFDTLTLGRIDHLYGLVVLCLHMACLTVTIYLYNLADDGRWKNTILGPYEEYFPLAIQFFFGGLSSAYVVYYFRSVSLSKTFFFFIILVALLFANEFLKQRISNKYLQFSVYFFISLTFFTFMIPVFIRQMDTEVFLYSGLVSFLTTVILILYIYWVSPSTRLEIHLGRLLGIVLSIYATVNLFYFLHLIPPVPLALDNGIVAHQIVVEDNSYLVTYERDEWYRFWRDHRLEYVYQSNEDIYIFSSIFAPTDLKKTVLHRWKWYNEASGEWEIVEDIDYDITGGRDGGYRGYTFKNNVKEGLWQVEVITDDELVLGVVDFKVVMGPGRSPKGLTTRRF